MNLAVIINGKYYMTVVVGNEAWTMNKETGRWIRMAQVEVGFHLSDGRPYYHIIG